MAVVGAGVFGAWTAHHLLRDGARVALLDAHGPAHARASSGGETRLIRIGYGPHEQYSRWSLESLDAWRELEDETGQPLFDPTGVLWIGRAGDTYVRATRDTLRALDVAHEVLTRADLRRRFPQCRFDDATWALLEPRSGALFARRAVQARVALDARGGLAVRRAAVEAPRHAGRGRRLAEVPLSDGSRVRAGGFVFACGPWLPRLFPRLLRGRIVPTRQEVFFFGTPAGDRRFGADALPAWIDFPGGVYGLPDLETRGVKLAFDRHGPAFDPERGSREVSPASVAAARRALAARFPDLARAPLLGTRVCQYENTSNGDFLIDRHPDFDNVWLVGGGSGHGFKHGPAVGAYAAGLVLAGGSPEPAFSLTTKQRMRARSVF